MMDVTFLDVNEWLHADVDVLTRLREVSFYKRD